jgi:hypothetical protein
MAVIFQPSLTRVLDIAGVPVSGAKMDFWLSGTTTPATFYTDAAGTPAGANPLVASVTGAFAPAYVDPVVAYRIRLTDSTGATVYWDVDPVQLYPVDYDLGTVTSTSDTLMSLEETLDSGSSGVGNFTGISVNQNVTNAGEHSKFFDFKLNGTTAITAIHRGEFVMYKPGDSTPGGIRCLNAGGVMALTSGADPNSGIAAPVVAWAWEGAVSDAAVLKGFGNNRLSIESINTMVMISDNSRFEFEGGFNNSSQTLNFFGYEKGSGIGRPFKFSNGGQTPTRASPLVIFMPTDIADKAFSWGRDIGGTETELGYVDAEGKIHSPGDTILADFGAMEVREWLTELVTVNAAATTDSTIQLPAGSRLDGFACRVVTAIPTATSFAVTTATTGNNINTPGGISTAAGSTDAKAAAQVTVAAQYLRIIPNATPAAATGEVRMVIWYTRFVAPTS